MAYSTMKRSKKRKTTSQALRSLGRINAVEGPIIYGLNSLYKYKNSGEPRDQIRELGSSIIGIKKLLKQMITIMNFEKSKNPAKFRNWMRKREINEKISRVYTLLGLYGILSDEQERNDLYVDIIKINKRLNRISKGKYNSKDIDKTIEFLQKLLSIIQNKVEFEKRMYEKIIGSKTLIL